MSLNKIHLPDVSPVSERLKKNWILRSLYPVALFIEGRYWMLDAP